ncbi:MAG TPA: hypothetical protein VGU21_07125, partial [Streptosporangiaceae bacterium]|nr:hypothetical protein [Streptosporangiaceae bacterium]
MTEVTCLTAAPSLMEPAPPADDAGSAACGSSRCLRISNPGKVDRDEKPARSVSRWRRNLARPGT